MSSIETVETQGDVENPFLNVEYGAEDVVKSSHSKNNKNAMNMNMNYQTPSSSNNDNHAHPQAAFFTVVFKAMSILLYMFGSWFTDNFVLIFVFIILCLAADFWTVKNVTGRLLVGLRWWNEVKDDGSSEWKFQARDDPATINNKDSRLFWSSLYSALGIWLLLCVAGIFKFNLKWIPLTMAGVVLNAAQVYGYYKCQRDPKQKIQNMFQQGLSKVGAGLIKSMK